MNVPGIGIIISMLETGLKVKEISEREKEIVNKAIVALKDIDAIGTINSLEIKGYPFI